MLLVFAHVLTHVSTHVQSSMKNGCVTANTTYCMHMNSGSLVYRAAKMAGFVAYLRVSTARQERSGLGLDAQRDSIQSYVNERHGALVAEFVEVESGGRNDRVELKNALTACRKNKATLVIARLDRVSRRVSFIASLMESGVGFVVADMANATDFQLHIYAAMAQEERRLIGLRTKAALAAAKVKGIILGKTGRALADRNKARARAFADGVRETLVELKEQGLSLRAIASTLNERGIASAQGGRWHLRTVQLVLERIR
jgi:DNA invertase Pin-like site-specific DNA recombinase